MKICDSYWITQALAVENYFDGTHQSRIYTLAGIKLSKLTPLELIDKACMHYGSTVDGRRVSASKTLNYSHKTPIVIAPYSVGAFPTTSYKKDNCVWIFNHPFQVEQLADGTSFVKFDQGTTITVNASKHTLLKQQQRLHTLLDIYRNAEHGFFIIFQRFPKQMTSRCLTLPMVFRVWGIQLKLMNLTQHDSALADASRHKPRQKTTASLMAPATAVRRLRSKSHFHQFAPFKFNKPFLNLNEKWLVF